MKRQKDRLHRVIVIGASPAGITATNKLGELGIPVTLVDSEININKKLSNEKWKLKSGVKFNHAHRPGLIRILRNPSINCMLPATVNSIKHNSQGFKVEISNQPTYVKHEKCTLCGKCLEICPVTLNDNTKPVQIINRLSLPGRPVIDKRREPLCRKECPLGVNVQGYIALAKEGKYLEALELIRMDNILPGICGRICIHPCENDCRRGEIDDPVSIRNIKRFLADFGAENQNLKLNLKKAEKRKEKVAIVGSGPTGLAAAAELARHGINVTVYEKEKEIGGFLRYAIGPHRLPRKIVNSEIKYIENLGVKFKPDTPIDLEKDLNGLKKKNDTVIIATGTWKDKDLGIPGEDLDGVEGCLEFLNRLYIDKKTKLKEKVAVIGDGNSAFDLARTLKRIGADVTIVSWFSKEKLPADQEEIKAAFEEGVNLVDNKQVIEFIGEKGKLTGIVCKETKPGKPDEKGIAWPVIKKGTKAIEIRFDRSFIAIGQAGPYDKSKKAPSVNKFGYIETESFLTSIDKIYAAGDTVTGPSSVVHAMAEGKKAAAQVLNDLCGIKVKQYFAQRDDDKQFPEIPKDLPKENKASMPEIRPSGRENNFSEVSLGLPESQVLYEAGRCLQCGICSECLLCTEACEAINAIDHTEHEVVTTEHAGIVIIADPDLAPSVKGDDVIRAYGPKSSKTDINAMMTRGFAAAANAMVLLGKTSQIRKGHGLSFSSPEPLLSPEIKIGVFVCKCNESTGWKEELDTFVNNLTEIDDVIHSEVLNSTCTPEGVDSILKAVREKGITRIALASCVCCPLNFVCSTCTDQRSRLKNSLFNGTEISRSMVETCNIRGEALGMINKDPELAEIRVKGLIERTIRRSRKLKLFSSPARIYNFSTAVIGESEAAYNSALTLAESGFDVLRFGTNGSKEKSIEDNSDHPNIHYFTDSVVSKLAGTLGDFQIEIKNGESKLIMQAGAVILDEKTRKKTKYIHQEDLPSHIVSSSMQKKDVTGIPFFYPGMTTISGLFVADPPSVSVSNRKKGKAAAVLAAAVMPRGPRQSKGLTVSVNKDMCRGCGRCNEVCLYQAVTLNKNEVDGWSATVDEAFCKGCGNCISVCPTNAADTPFRNQSFLEKTLEEILL